MRPPKNAYAAACTTRLATSTAAVIVEVLTDNRNRTASDVRSYFTKTGGNLAEILTNLAHVIRERFKLKGQVRSASAHGRMTGTILTLMPVALMFGMLAVAPGYLQSMVDDPLGRKMVIAVIIGVILGHFTIRKIVKIKV